jgi:hypothetical protein
MTIRSDFTVPRIGLIQPKPLQQIGSNGQLATLERLFGCIKAAEFAGLPRETFMLEISRLGVSPFQYTAESLNRELSDAD